MKFLLFLALFVASGMSSLFAESNFQHTPLPVVRMHPSQIKKPVTEAQKLAAVISEIKKDKSTIPHLETGKTFRHKIVVSNLSRDSRCPANQVDMQILLIPLLPAIHGIAIRI